MKALAFSLSLVFVLAGCKAMDSLIFHPLHVLHEEHENNEAEKKAEAAFTNANDWQSADTAIRLKAKEAQ